MSLSMSGAVQKMFEKLFGEMRDGCNFVEIHIIRPSDGSGGCQTNDSRHGAVSVDLPRDNMVEVMRAASRSISLSPRMSHQRRLQSTHIGDMTMERTLGNSKEIVESSFLLGVQDISQDNPSLPLVWLEWTKRRLPASCFPCTIQNDDLRHCIRREMSCGAGVTLVFETNMNETCRAVYRAWFQVTVTRDFAAASAAIARALDVFITG